MQIYHKEQKSFIYPNGAFHMFVQALCGASALLPACCTVDWPVLCSGHSTSIPTHSHLWNEHYTVCERTALRTGSPASYRTNSPQMENTASHLRRNNKHGQNTWPQLPSHSQRHPYIVIIATRSGNSLLFVTLWDCRDRLLSFGWWIDVRMIGCQSESVLKCLPCDCAGCTPPEIEYI